MNAVTHHRPQHRQHGFSLIELMVGLTVGLIVLAGATSWAGQVLGHQQRQQRLSQLHMELRALAAHLQLELGRAGAHGQPSALVWRPDANATPNRLAAITFNEGGREVLFQRVVDASTDSGTNNTGFRLADGRLDQLVGQRYQPLTDPAWMRITAFTASLETRTHPWPSSCGQSVRSRAIVIDLTAHAVDDPSLTRRLRMTVQPRNDLIDGNCG